MSFAKSIASGMVSWHLVKILIKVEHFLQHKHLQMCTSVEHFVDTMTNTGLESSDDYVKQKIMINTERHLPLPNPTVSFLFFRRTFTQ